LDKTFGTPPPNFEKAKKSKNKRDLGQCRTLIADIRRIRNKFRYRQWQTNLIGNNFFWRLAKKLINFGPLTTKFFLRVSTYTKATERAILNTDKLWS